MKDSLGLYYFPHAGNNKARVYVRRNDGELEFRLWLAEAPEAWEKHGWLPLSVIREAARLYAQEKRAGDPTILYDEQVAEALLAEDEKGRGLM